MKNKIKRLSIITILVMIISIVSGIFISHYGEVTTRSIGSDVTATFNSSTGELTINATAEGAMMYGTQWNSLKEDIGATNIVKVTFTGNRVKTTTNMYDMFSGCDKLETVTNFTNFDSSGLFGAYHMFYFCRSLKSIDLSAFDTTDMTNLQEMFGGCSSLTELDLSNFNTAKVTNMSGLFYYCNKLESINLSSFNTASVTNMENMFYSCSSLKSLDLSNFNTSNVTNMTYMFAFMFTSEDAMTRLNLQNFDMSKLTSEGADKVFWGNTTLYEIKTPRNYPSHQIALPGDYFLIGYNVSRDPISYMSSSNFSSSKTIRKYLKVSYDANGGTGTMETQNKQYYGYVYLTENAFEAPEGKAFLRWNTKADGSGNNYGNGAYYSDNHDATMYAQWTTVGEHTVTFKDGEKVLDTQIVEYQGDATAPEIEKEGYTLSWNRGFTSVVEDITVNAVWTINPRYELGSYVNYTFPTSGVTLNAEYTGADSAQSFSSSTYTGGWRILSDNGEYIELIAAESVGDLTLAKHDGYRYSVYCLNEISRMFKNDTYAELARSVGSTEDSVEDVGEYVYPAALGEPFNESLYYKDYNNMRKGDIVGGSYWLASRVMYSDLNQWQEQMASARIVKDNGDVGCIQDDSHHWMFWNYYNYNARTNSGTFGVRPVIKLKKNVRMVSGDGTEANPYQLGYVTYKEFHYKQTEDLEGYELADYEEHLGSTADFGTRVSANPKTYEEYVENTTHEDRKTEGTIPVDGGLELKFFYDIVREATVTFKNGDEVISTQVVNVGESATAPELTKAGYTLSWDKDFTNVKEDMEVNAVWIANTDTQYKVEYYFRNKDEEVEGYDLDTARTVYKTGTTDTIATITDADKKNITGFTFDEDNTNNVLSGTVTADGSLTLKLYYNRNIYNVTYELNTESGQKLYDTYAYGKEYVLSRDITRDHYVFEGWYDNANFTGSEVTKISAGETGDKTFYAKWRLEDFYKRSDKYEVDYEKNIIYKVSPETTVEEFKSKIDTNGTMSVIGHVGNSEGVLPENGFVSTGDKLKVVYNGTTYTYHIAVRGDLNGDGKVTLTDLSLMNQVLVGKTTLTELKDIAADINYDGSKTLIDLSLINQAIVAKIVL